MASVATQNIPLTKEELEATPEPPVVFSFSSYYTSLKKKSENLTVPWEEYQRASLINNDQLTQIRTFDRESVAGRKKLISEQSSVYVPLLVHLLSVLNKEETLQYLLAIQDGFFEESPEIVSQFHKLSESNQGLPFAPYLKLLEKSDAFIGLAASKILVTLACTSSSPASLDLSPLFSYLSTQLLNSNTDISEVALQNVQSLLSVIDLRLPIYDFQGNKIISGLSELLRGSHGPQVLYQTLFCFWLLTFDHHIAREIHQKFDIIPCLTDIGKGAIKEKVIRMVLAVFRNLVNLAPNENTVHIIGSKTIPFLNVLKQRKFQDNEIIEDADYLLDQLRDSLQKLSSFDEYMGEILSGKLEWSPVHTSELFWKQNVTKFNEKDFELIRALTRLLLTSNDVNVLSVAAYDLGQYVKYYPNGRKIIQELGAKHKLMEMMSHENADVRYQALMAVQKFMTQTWSN